MALVERYVDPKVAPGGDGSLGNPYASLTEWNAAEQTNLVTAEDQHVVYCRNGESIESFTHDGWTTDATYTVTIRAYAGEEHLGVARAGFHIHATAGIALRTLQENTYIEDLEFWNTGTGSGGSAIETVASWVYFRRCIFGPVTKVTASFLGTSGGNVLFESCLFDGGGNELSYNFAASTPVWRHCTGVNADGQGWQITGGPFRYAYNCVSINNAGQDYNGGAQWSGDYNASGDTTARGFTQTYHNVPSTDFVDYAGRDYHIASTGSVLYDGGDADELPNPNLDITRTPFATTDIGCYAYVEGVPGETVDPADIDQSQLIASPALTEHASALVANLDQPQVIGEPTLSPLTGVGPADLVQPQAIGEPTLSPLTGIGPASLAQSQVIGEPALSEHVSIVVYDLEQAQALGEPLLTERSALAVANLIQAQLLSEPTLVPDTAIAVAGLEQAQTLGEPALTSYGYIFPVDLSQAQALSEPALSESGSLTVAAIDQLQALENADLQVGFALIPASIDQIQAIDAAALIEHGLVTADDLAQAQVLPGVTFGTQRGWLVGKVAIFPTLQGLVTINRRFDA